MLSKAASAVKRCFFGSDEDEDDDVDVDEPSGAKEEFDDGSNFRLPPGEETAAAMGNEVDVVEEDEDDDPAAVLA